jgi:predicted nucleic-acid-binding Zn-ribbon protein
MTRKLDQDFSRRFVCPKCSNKGGEVRRLSMTGAGLSRLLDIQHIKFLNVSCRKCGYTEQYDLKVLEGVSRGMDILDVILDE